MSNRISKEEEALKFPFGLVDEQDRPTISHYEMFLLEIQLSI